VKQVVKQNEPEGVTEQGLSEIGFLFLHTLFIQRGRLETTWAVLRTFGYGDDLTLREDFLFPPFEVPPDCTVELSSDGYQFLTDLFQCFDKDNDGALNDNELEELFSTAPGIPWEGTGTRESITNEEGSITLQGFLAQWSMTTLLNHKITLSYFAYLGFFDKDTTKALKVIRRRRPSKKEKQHRDVFLSFVFGAAGSGKTTILKSFIKHEFKDTYIPTISPYSVVNSIEIGGSEKYLIVRLVNVDARIWSSFGF
jgi:mitochondrial Rho GTPase 1